eukprot:3889579-Pyramimonas_sp.AAC.1
MQYNATQHNAKQRQATQCNTRRSNAMRYTAAHYTAMDGAPRRVAAPRGRTKKYCPLHSPRDNALASERT